MVNLTKVSLDYIEESQIIFRSQKPQSKSIQPHIIDVEALPFDILSDGKTIDKEKRSQYVLQVILDRFLAHNMTMARMSRDATLFIDAKSMKDCITNLASKYELPLSVWYENIKDRHVMLVKTDASAFIPSKVLRDETEILAAKQLKAADLGNCKHFKLIWFECEDAWVCFCYFMAVTTPFVEDAKGNVTNVPYRCHNTANHCQHRYFC